MTNTKSHQSPISLNYREQNKPANHKQRGSEWHQQLLPECLDCWIPAAAADRAGQYLYARAGPCLGPNVTALGYRTGNHTQKQILHFTHA